MQSWVPVKATDPDSQHEITQLRQQVAELRQQVGDTPNGTDPPSSSSPAAPFLHIYLPSSGLYQGASAPPAPPAFEPQCLLTIPGCPNSWLTTHLPNSLRQATVTTWFNKSQSSTGTEEYHPVQHGQSGCMVERPTNLALWTPFQKVAIMTGIPLNLLQKNFDATQLIRVLTIASRWPTD